jgi:hypothetical protein
VLLEAYLRYCGVGMLVSKMARALESIYLDCIVMGLSWL